MNSETRRPGKVFLVGAGPGDPSLITVRGVELLKKAEVVVYDHLANKKLLQYAPKNAEMIYAGKKGGVKHTLTQEEINQMLIDRAMTGKRVVRLKGGDPFIFGRGGEEIEELFDAGIPFEVVPGVTSATAAATYAGVPITHRDFTSSVAFVTGHEDPTKETSNIAWDKLATGIGTLVFYMGIKNLPLIASRLIENGRNPQTPTLVVRWASTPEQRSVVGPLAEIAAIAREADIKPPALVVVGDVVKLRDKINWFEKKPLFGKRVLVTRTREQASELVALLEEHGADCLEGSTINIVPPDSWEEADRAIDSLSRYDWLLFTSLNAVKFFFMRLNEKGRDARALHNVKLGVVGAATADVLNTYGLVADLVPEEFTGDGLADAMLRQGVTGKRILIPRALKAREVLPKTLREGGADVTVASVYQNVQPEQYDEIRKALSDKSVDIITFTSSSTVSNFVDMLKIDSSENLHALLKGITVASIGPVTSKTARDNGLDVHIQPKTFTIPALVDEIVDYFTSKTTR